MPTSNVFSRGGLLLETRVAYGSAARHNRGAYSGQKVHKLYCQYVVGLEEGYVPKPGTIGFAFSKTGQQELYSCYPACRCTRGQNAGKPRQGLEASDVTCGKCQTKP